mmetsp:Transcript_5690/g.14789  ORF Transcript_5690/g.14789 Transcript_5690/m.14789 type:complete len:236 (+) Transcript_5690:1251-1958(+)
MLAPTDPIASSASMLTRTTTSACECTSPSATASTSCSSRSANTFCWMASRGLSGSTFRRNRRFSHLTAWRTNCPLPVCRNSRRRWPRGACSALSQKRRCCRVVCISSSTRLEVRCANATYAALARAAPRSCARSQSSSSSSVPSSSVTRCSMSTCPRDATGRVVERSSCCASSTSALAARNAIIDDPASEAAEAGRRPPVSDIVLPPAGLGDVFESLLPVAGADFSNGSWVRAAF